MSVLAHQNSELSPLPNPTYFLPATKPKMSIAREILDQLQAKKVQKDTSFPNDPSVRLELIETSSPDDSPSREASRMVIKSPKKGILVRRRINDPSPASAGRPANETQTSYFSAFCLGETTPMKNPQGVSLTTPQTEYCLSNHDEPIGQEDNTMANIPEDEKDKREKRVTFDASTCFLKSSPNSRRRPFMIRSSKTLTAFYAKERGQRSNDLNQKASKLTIFKKNLDNVQLQPGSAVSLNLGSPKIFTPQNKIALPNKLDSNTPSYNDSKKEDAMKKPEWNEYYLRRPVIREKGREIESASVSLRGSLTPKENTGLGFKGLSSERSVESQYGRRFDRITSPSDSLRSTSNNQGTAQYLIGLNKDKMTPKKGGGLIKTTFSKTFTLQR